VTELRPRAARAGDYEAIASAVDEWWGRPVLGALPRLFLDYFHRSSLVIDGPAGLLAFLVGILSPSDPRQAYVHFAGVAGGSLPITALSDLVCLFHPVHA